MTWLSFLNTNLVTTSQINVTLRFSFVKLHNITAHARIFPQLYKEQSLQITPLILNFNWEK